MATPTPANLDTPSVSSLSDPKVIAALKRQAAVLTDEYFPRAVIGALGLGDKASATAVRLCLARFRHEAGTAHDSVEKVLLDQLIVAHLKVGDLYARAAEATNLQFKQLYTNAVARLVGTICQLVATLAAYRSSARPRRRHAKARRKVGAGTPPAGGRESSKPGRGKGDDPQGRNGKGGRR